MEEYLRSLNTSEDKSASEKTEKMGDVVLRRRVHTD